MQSDTSGPIPRAGRRNITSAAELEETAFELFDKHGFEHTTIADITAAAGIARRTFFHYFPSKNDIPWGDFDAGLERMRADFRALPRDLPLLDAVRHCVVEFNRVPDEQLAAHRRRMRLILGVPALQAHSTLRFQSWREVVAEFVADRLNVPQDSLTPQTIAHATLGVAVAAYHQWLARPELELSQLLDTAMRELAAHASPPNGQ